MQSTCLFLTELISQVFSQSVSKLFLLKTQLESLELEILLRFHHHHHHHHLYCHCRRHHPYLCPYLYHRYLKLNVLICLFQKIWLILLYTKHLHCKFISLDCFCLILLSKLDFDKRHNVPPMSFLLISLTFFC